MATALGDERVPHRCQHLEFSDHPVAAAVLAAAARSAPDRVFDHPERELELQSLDGRVERIAHGHVDGARPVGVRAGALPTADRLVVHDLLVAQGQVVHGALPDRAAEGAQHHIRHPGRGLDVAAHDRRGGAGVQERALGGDHFDRPVGTRGRRNVRIGQDPDGEIACRPGYGEGTVEVAVGLGSAAGEIQLEAVAPHGGTQHDREIPFPRLEYVLRPVLAVLELPQAGAGAALGVIERFVERPAEGRGAHPGVELLGAQDADPACRQLRPQIRPPLLGAAHHLAQLDDRCLVEHAGLDHHTLVGQSPAVGRHRARSWPSDVGVMGAAGGEGDQLALREDRGDDRDVRQVRATAVGIVEHPRAPRGMILLQDGRHRGRHRPEVNRDVLGLHHHLPAGRE